MCNEMMRGLIAAEIKVLRQEMAFMERSMARLEESRVRIMGIHHGLAAQYDCLHQSDKMGKLGGRMEAQMDELCLAMDQVEAVAEVMPRDELEVAVHALDRLRETREEFVEVEDEPAA